MKINKKWCIVLIMILVIMTTIPIFAESAESAESGGLFNLLFKPTPMMLAIGAIGGGLGVLVSFLKGKDARKRK